MTFDVWTVALPPGGARSYDAAEWRDALVLVASGTLELESARGERQRFATGATLWLARLSLRALHNPASEAMLLIAISRRPMTFRARPVSTSDGFERRRWR